MLSYEAKTWGVSAAYDVIRGGPGAFGGLSSSGMSDKRLALGAYALFDRAKLGLGLIRRDNDASTTPKSDLWYAGATYDVTPQFNFGGQVYLLNFHDSPNDAHLYTLRGTYSFSKRSSMYATVGYIQNKGKSSLSVSQGAPGSNPAPGAGQFGAMLGIKHIF